MNQLKSLGIQSFTVVANDETRRKSLTKTLAGYLIVAGLTAGAVGQSYGADQNIADSHAIRGQVNELLSSHASEDSPKSLIEGRESLFQDLTKKSSRTIASETAKDILAGKSALYKDKEDGLDQLAMNTAKPVMTAVKSSEIAIDMTYAILNPELTAAAWAAKLTAGTATAVVSEDMNHGLHLASAISGAATATILGPAGMGIYAASQVYQTYTYVKDSKLRKEAIEQLRLDVYEAQHEVRVHGMNIERYKDERAAWAEMPESQQAERHDRYVEATAEYLLDPSKSSWISATFFLENEVGGLSDEYMPWFSEGVARAHEMKAAMDLEADGENELTVNETERSIQGDNSVVSSLNSLVQAMDTATPASSSEKKTPAAPRMR